MFNKKISNISPTLLLLTSFNNRSVDAFGELYAILYNDLYFFATKLYMNTEVEPQDAVHDTFLRLWQSKNTKFEKIIDVKAYLFISIKNDFHNYINHSKYIDIYKKHQLNSRDNIDYFEVNVIESEIFNNFTYILKLLPEESANILRLFFSGWSAEEIAEKLGKNKQTIYNKKSEAISFLKSRLSKDKLLFLLLFIR